MSNTTRLAAEWEPRILSVLRIIVGLLFMEHGLGKLIGFPPMPTQPAAFHLLWFAGIIETVGGDPGCDWSVHPRSGFHCIGRDGDRLLHGARATRPVPRLERRRCSDPL